MTHLSHSVFDLLGQELNPVQERAFALYASELAIWNEQVSLTAITDPEEVQIKHFLDSLSCWLTMRTKPVQRVIDLGAGAGFPGLPLKILRPEIQLVLVESVGKKAAFLQHIVQVLGLSGVSVLNQRAEIVGQDTEHRETYDWALARALAPMPVLAEYLLPFVRLGGYALAQKGPAAPDEVRKAGDAIQILGGGEPALERVDVPGLRETRYLVILKKIAKSPEKYPRRVGIPTKRPL
ncbi:MAG: 16S rRNA (guanine(527)-N(7))-methyltransferase RsmG [Chloroflexi bacterium]|nr:16S rRNA (guanine(527)-N(7))-methyltransferase RsmG [Chloroflexota bacterium]